MIFDKVELHQISLNKTKKDLFYGRGTHNKVIQCVLLIIHLKPNIVPIFISQTVGDAKKKNDSNNRHLSYTSLNLNTKSK